MVENNFSKTLAERTFEYGKHIVYVRIRMKYGYKSSVEYGTGQDGYYQVVFVKAYKKSEWDSTEEEPADGAIPDVNNSTAAEVKTGREETTTQSESDQPNSFFKRLIWKVFIKSNELDQNDEVKSETTVTTGPVIELSEQIEETVRPVLEEVDTQYRILDNDYEIDIDVSVEMMSAETSWSSIESEMERISKELDMVGH